MKVVILAGGFGTRFSEETHKIPKPLIKIGSLPILIHIMNIYSVYNYRDFIICGGYKNNKIINFFKKNKYFTSTQKKKWRVEIINTGIKTNTAGRILKIQNYITTDNFFLTYGDGLSNINIKQLLKSHLNSKKIATVTAVKPPARFGVLKIKKNGSVNKFQEKVDNKNVWINGGFFVFNKKIFKYIKKNNDSLESNVITKLVNKNSLNAYKHNSFWQPMDTLRDKIKLTKLLKNKQAPWIINKNPKKL